MYFLPCIDLYGSALTVFSDEEGMTFFIFMLVDCLCSTFAFVVYLVSFCDNICAFKKANYTVKDAKGGLVCNGGKGDVKLLEFGDATSRISR